jgi:hypothetical protein
VKHRFIYIYTTLKFLALQGARYIYNVITVRVNVRCPYYSPVLKKIEISQQIFEKYSNMEYHETFFVGSRAVP